ncbi:MAG: MarR family transcriptional regulator [Acidimicrobiia bacterium]|nr:MarR family transcriptional regulator [Acidimicrobiia bacterium]
MISSDPLAETQPGRIVAWLGRQVTHALRTVDLSDSQYRMLAFLAGGASAATPMAGRLDLSRPSITALVDGLEARGHVERCTDETDRRRVRLSLTPAGEAALVAADRVVNDRLDQVLGHLPPVERERAAGCTRLWGKALLAIEQAPG